MIAVILHGDGLGRRLGWGGEFVLRCNDNQAARILMFSFVKRVVVLAMLSFLAWPIIFNVEIIEAAEPGLPTANIHGKALDEISGMTHAESVGQYWGLSDSGFAPNIHRFNDRGEVLQAVALEGATNRDFEAMTRDTHGHMYISDTGDNGLTRGHYQIYQISADLPAGASSAKTVRIDFKYEDGQSRNCEAIFALDRKLILLTKQETYDRQPEVFVLDIPADGGHAVAKFIGHVDLQGRVTDVAYSPPRKLLAVLTYHGIAFFDFSAPKDLLTKPKHYVYGSFAKCESICFDGDSIVLTNENDELWKRPVEEYLGMRWVGATRPKQKLAKLISSIRLDGHTDDWPAGVTTFDLKPERSGVTFHAKMMASQQGWHVAITIPYTSGGGGSRPIGDTLFVMVSPEIDSAFPAADTSVYALTVIDKKKKAKVFRVKQPLPWDGRGDWKTQSSPAGSAAIHIADGKLTIEATIGQAYLHRLVSRGNRDIRFNMSLLSWQGKKPSFWSWAGPLRGHGDEKLQSWGTVSVAGG